MARDSAPVDLGVRAVGYLSSCSPPHDATPGTSITPPKRVGSAGPTRESEQLRVEPPTASLSAWEVDADGGPEELSPGMLRPSKDAVGKTK